jgi:thiamine pyrophosphokinase
MAAPSASDTIIVVTGGDPVDPAELGRIPEGALVIAADSGVELAQLLGSPIHLAIGDFDSVDPDALRRAEADGAIVERHPAAKDATDLELALDAALARAPSRIQVLGGHGGRLDHLLANVLLLASPACAGVEIVAHMGPTRVTVVRTSATLLGQPGDLVTLLAAHGVAQGVTTEGLLYPLTGDDLRPGSTRGVSNELVASHAVVHVERGVVLAVQPGQRGTHHLQRTMP